MAIDLGDMPKGTPPTPQQQAQIRSSIGLGSSGSAGFSSLVLTGQSITGTAANSLLDLATTWNTSGIPSAIKLNVNNVASGVGSNLLDLQLSGTSKFKVTKDGNVVTANVDNVGFWTSGNAQHCGMIGQGLAILKFRVNATERFTLTDANCYFANASTFGFSDILLARDAAGILAQRNVGTAQAFRVYNSTDATPATNFDRATFGWTSNVLRIGTEIGGTYTTARGIEFVTNSILRMSIAAAGTVHIQGSMSMGGNYDSIAPSGVAGYLSLSGYNGAGLSASGTLIFRSKPTINIAYMPLAFSGETSAFPAIKRNGAGLDIRLADDSALTNLSASEILLSSGLVNGANVSQLKIKTTDGGTGCVGIMGTLWNMIGLWAPGTNLASYPGLGVGQSSILLNLPVGDTGTSIRLNGRGDIGATNPGVLISSGGAAVKAFAVRAFASQTATLTEWQNSAGAILGSVSAIGDLSLAGSTGVTLTGGGGFRSTSYIDVNTIGITTSSTGVIGFSSGATGATYDTALFRDAAGTLAQRNAGNAQTFRIYNTYTNSGVDYERISMGWSAGTFVIGREFGGTGGARNINLVGGSSVLGIGSTANAGVDWTFSAGHLLTGTDNTKDIGASGANRPRNVYVGGTIISGGIGSFEGVNLKSSGGAVRLTSPSYGKMTILDSDGTGNFTQLSFAGNTSSFPAIKRNGAGLDIRLADDSAYANLGANAIILEDSFAIKGVTTTGWIEIGNKANVLTPNTSKIAFWESILGLIQLANNGSIAWSSSSFAANANGDTYLTRRAAANLRLGTADAAAPVAQTLSVQSVIAGTTNTAGTNLTITGSQGTGTGAGGSVIFQVAPAGSSGSAQNALSTALTIDSSLNTNSTNNFVVPNTLGKGFWVTGSPTHSGMANGGGLATLDFKCNAETVLTLLNAASQRRIQLHVNGQLGFSSDLTLVRDDPNTLAQRNAANAQIFRIYNTYTDATTFERLNLKWDTNVLKIGTEKGSVGGTGRALRLEAGTGFLNFDYDGAITLQGVSSQPVSIQAAGNAALNLKSSGNQQVLVDSANSSTVIRRSAGASTSDTSILGIAQTDGSTISFYSKTNSVVDTEFSILGGSSYLRRITFGGSVVAGGMLGTDVHIKGGLAGTNTLRCGDVYLYGMSSLGSGRSGNVILQNDSSTATNGNVGIGNIAPLSKFDISDTWNSNISVTGASGTGTVATITFAAQTTAIAIGSTIVVASINPAGYNGTFIVTASSLTSVSYANVTTAAWVSGGTVQRLFTAVKLNITDTASNGGSKLLDLQTGGVSLFAVRKDGAIAGSLTNTIFGGGLGNLFSGRIHVADYNFSVGSPSLVQIAIETDGSDAAQALVLNSTAGVWWSSLASASTVGQLRLAADLALRRDTSNALAQRNGSNAQTFRIYNTYTDATTFERLNLKWDTNVLKIGTEKGSVGGAARAMEFQTDGATRMTITSTGDVGIGTISPSTKLDIISPSLYTGAVQSWVASANSNYNLKLNMLNPGAVTYSFDLTNAGTLYSNNLVLDRGSVGIGTATPQNKLDVNGDTRVGGWLHVDRTGGSLSSYLAFKVRGAAEAGNFGNPAGNGQAEINFANVSGLVIGTNATSPIIFATQNLERLRILGNNGNVGIGTITPAEKLDVVGNVKVSGHFSAATKSFLIDHPTKAGKKLQYGVVESNQHSVLVRGKTAESIIELPEEWAGLVHEDSVTVQLTPIDSYQSLFVISQDNQKVVVGGSSGQYNYTIYGERKDVDKLVTEI